MGVNGLIVHLYGKALASPPRMADGYGVVATLANLQACRRRERIVGLLHDDKWVTVQSAGCEQVHVECRGSVVGIDEVPVFGVILHAGTHTAPHALVNL